MMYQKPEALNLTNNSLHNEYLQVKLLGQKGLLWHIAAPKATRMNEVVMEKRERQKSKMFFVSLM